jgi:hypothetical protein
MKIIGRTDKGYLCEVSQREVSLLKITDPNLGDEYDMTHAFDALDRLRGIGRANLQGLSMEIKRLHDRFDALTDSYNRAMLTDVLKSTENTDGK